MDGRLVRNLYSLGSRPSHWAARDGLRGRADEGHRPAFLELLLAETAADTGAGAQLRVGITMLAFAGFVDALRLAGDIGDRSRPSRCGWALTGRDPHPVTASRGAALAHWATFGDPRRFDYEISERAFQGRQGRSRKFPEVEGSVRVVGAAAARASFRAHIWARRRKCRGTIAAAWGAAEL